MIYASVKQPFQYQIDEAKFSRAATRITARLSRDAFTELESRADGGKLRPCLILGDGPDDDDPNIPLDERRSPPVALLATFGNTDMISKFPRGVRHHLVPIHKSAASHLGRREHLHTAPEWDGRPSQYIIAYEYTPSENKVIQHFKSPRTDKMPDGTNYSIGPQALSEFNHLCMMRTRMWQQQPDAQKTRDARELLRWNPPRQPKNWDARTFATAAPGLSRETSGIACPRGYVTPSVRQLTVVAEDHIPRREPNSNGSSSPLRSSFRPPIAGQSNIADVPNSEPKRTVVERKGTMKSSPYATGVVPPYRPPNPTNNTSPTQSGGDTVTQSDDWPSLTETRGHTAKARSEDIKGTASVQVARPLHTGGQRRHRHSQSASPRTNIPAAPVPSSPPTSLPRTNGTTSLAHSTRNTLVFGQVQPDYTPESGLESPKPATMNLDDESYHANNGPSPPSGGSLQLPYSPTGSLPSPGSPWSNFSSASSSPPRNVPIRSEFQPSPLQRTPNLVSPSQLSSPFSSPPRTPPSLTLNQTGLISKRGTLPGQVSPPPPPLSPSTLVSSSSVPRMDVDKTPAVLFNERLGRLSLDSTEEFLTPGISQDDSPSCVMLLSAQEVFTEQSPLGLSCDSDFSPKVKLPSKGSTILPASAPQHVSIESPQVSVAPEGTPATTNLPANISTDNGVSGISSSDTMKSRIGRFVGEMKDKARSHKAERKAKAKAHKGGNLAQ